MKPSEIPTQNYLQHQSAASVPFQLYAVYEKMPKKKLFRNNPLADFTVNDCANAAKPVTKVKKSIPVETATPDLSWDQIDDHDLDILEETNPDGTKNFVYKRRRLHSKSQTEIDYRPGIEYPEIVWYFLSHYIKPEDIGRFAGINRTCYAITKRESFWRTLYKRHCEFHPKLPEKMRIENSYMLYGLRQRVIRALYHTYSKFTRNHIIAWNEDRPYQLVKRCCINVWYTKEDNWLVYFKFKKHSTERRGPLETGMDFIEELGRIDANPEEDMQVMQVTCESVNEVPPLMGMYLSSVSVALSQGFRKRRLHLGFNSSRLVSKQILPEQTVTLEGVERILVFDWWHPSYPYFDNTLPSNFKDDISMPVLKNDFFKMKLNDL